jgi:Glycine rich protein
MAERWLVRIRTRLAASSTLALLAAAFQMTPVAAVTQSQTFNHTGGDQTFTVPPGVTSLHVTLVGARGGNGFASFSSFGVGGFGATVTADLAVAPGSTIHVEVGGAGGSGTTTPDTAGFNGGGASGANSVPAGGGGGATD